MKKIMDLIWMANKAISMKSYHEAQDYLQQAYRLLEKKKGPREDSPEPQRLV